MLIGWADGSLPSNDVLQGRYNIQLRKTRKLDYCFTNSNMNGYSVVGKPVSSLGSERVLAPLQVMQRVRPIQLDGGCVAQ